jgi:hypothetical protein
MDVDTLDFHADFGALRDVIHELEHKLGALILQVRVRARARVCA